MATVTENDLKELKDLITAQSGQIANIQTQITDLRISMGKVEATLQAQQPYIQKIPDLAEKVGELTKWRQIGYGLITGVFGAVFALIGLLLMSLTKVYPFHP